MKVEHKVRLDKLTTLGIGGEADFFVEVESPAKLQEVLNWARAQDLPFFVLGGGSNVLISDNGFPGLVIKNSIKGVKFNEDNTVVAGAGEIWDYLVEKSIQRGMWGIENLSFVPGSVGAAPVQNIGCYGTELKDVFLWAEVLEVESGKIKELSVAECQFGYRDSIFKQNPGKFVVLKVVLGLQNKPQPNLFYKDLEEYFKERESEPNALEIRNALWQIRSQKGMVISEGLPKSAGSFFRNPVVSIQIYEQLKKKYPDISAYPVGGDQMKIPAAWLIDAVCGLKGYRKGNVGVSQKQAVAIVNYGRASASEVDELAKEIELKVKESTRVELEREVRRVGFE